MYRSRKLASKVLLWLAAVLVPFQALPTSPCCCAIADEQEADVGKQQRQPGAHASCCSCRSTPSQSASTCRGAKSCCKQAGPAPARSCCGCPPTCTCQQDNPPPPASPPLTEHRSHTVDQLAQSAASVCPRLGEPQPRSADERPVVFTSASELRITLCRFHL